MTDLRYAESIFVARSPEILYDMISDVSRMGEWSPVCTACWWDDGDGPRPGVVGGSRVRWAYTFTPADGGT
jgi:hypothetical protein